MWFKNGYVCVFFVGKSHHSKASPCDWLMPRFFFSIVAFFCIHEKPLKLYQNLLLNPFTGCDYTCATHIHKQHINKANSQREDKARVWKDPSVTRLKDCGPFVPSEMRFLIKLFTQSPCSKGKAKMKIIQQSGELQSALKCVGEPSRPEQGKYYVEQYVRARG